MIAAIFKPSIIQEREMDNIPTQPDIKVYPLAMQWSLDENSKLICRWVKVQK